MDIEVALNRKLTAATTRVTGWWGRQSSLVKTVVITVAVALVFGAGVWVLSQPREATSRDATSACEGMVEDRLKAPATADFDTRTAVEGDSGWVVTGVVDSQNGFGAQIRSAYRCTITHDGGDRWSGRVTVN